MVQAATARGEAAWNELIEEQAESTPGSFLQEGEVLSRGDSAEAPVPMRVSDLRYKGYVQVWDTQTGVESLQPWWLLWQTMRKRREDGSLAFTRTNPNIPQDNGEDMFCPLNPLAPAGQRFSGKGFKPCKKRHIPHWDALQRHIQKSHGRAWEAMERERHDRERAEDRELQRAALHSQQQFMEALLRNAAPASVAAPAPVPVSMACALCDAPMTGSSPADLSVRMREHQQAIHAEELAAASGSEPASNKKK